jgi:hypothetical protein
MSGVGGWKKKPFWIRILHWEYWSFNMIYAPIYPIFIFLCLRARSFFFFSAANPEIKNGGFLGESKKEIYTLVPSAYQPKTIFFTRGFDPGKVMEQLREAGLRFPLIGKPDMGGRGRGVKKLDDAEDVRIYARDCLVDFHIQEFILFENEAGIFYYRFPGQARGKISGIVHKEFLRVKGDGVQNIRTLLNANSRGLLQLPQLEKTEKELLDTIPGAGEEVTVVPYGNHARGALFLDDSGSVNQALVDMMDEVCSKIPSFFFGRLDIRYQSRELLEKGKSFSILEVNGAGSEPTHMYDPRHSIFFAWKEIIRHWILLFKISRANHKLGYPYLSISEGLRMFREDRYNSELLKIMQTKSG